MKLFITSIYDHIAKSYTLPSFVVTTGVAVRAFAHAANDPDHTIGKHPGDFSMFLLGEFEDEQGEFTIYPVPSSLGLAASFVKAKYNVQHQDAPQPRTDALVQPRAAGGNSAKQL